MALDEKLVHGYVHGHIHKHKDHTHIHGHIHSHDQPSDKGFAQLKGHNSFNEGLTTTETYSDLSTRQTINDAGAENTTASHDLMLDCPLSNSICEEIFCSELDDCFYTNCSDTRPDEKCFHEDMCCPTYNVCRDEGCKACITAPTTMETTPILESTQDAVCSDAACLHNSSTQICCFDPSHLKEHENSLCKGQNSEMFSQMLNNIHADFNDLNSNVTTSERPTKKRALDKASVFNVHYPFETHPMDGGDHSIHQAFFHTTIPDDKPSPNDLRQLADYDFHFKFNNYDFLNNKSQIEYLDNFTCKWDNCQRTVNDNLFSEHLLHHLDEQKDENFFNCEWENCNYADSKLDNLLDHLNTHKIKQEPDLLTPASNHITPSPTTSDINMASVKITPRKQQIDPTFACHWEVIDEDGNAVKCNKRHSCASDLHEHLISDHVGSGNSSYSCCWVGCERHNGKIFNQRQKLIRHIHIHTHHKPWKCEQCGSSFAVESMLIQHMRIHSGEKPFQCNICGKHFATSSSLSIHNRIHTGEKPLICKYPKCGKKFSESSNLTKHMKTHQTFHCDVCGESFVRKTQYMKHMREHSFKSGPSPSRSRPMKAEPVKLES